MWKNEKQITQKHKNLKTQKPQTDLRLGFFQSGDVCEKNQAILGVKER